MAVTINGSTGIASVDASVSAPSVRGTDGNTGISYGADSIKFSTGGVERLAISNSGVSGVGKILQVLSDTKTDQSSTSSQTWADLPGLSIAITPASTSNKILVSWFITAGNGGGEWALRLRRDSTDIAQGTISDNPTVLTKVTDAFYGGSDTGEGNYGLASRNGHWLDSPSSTSAITYGFQWSNMSSSGTVYINRGSYDSGIYGPRGVSSITVTEVAG